MMISKLLLAMGAPAAILIISNANPIFDGAPQAIVPKPAAVLPQGEKPRVDFDGEPLPHGAIFRLGSTRYRTGSRLYGLGFMPDSKTIVTAGQTIQFWDSTNGKIIRQIDTSKFALRSGFALSADGKQFAVGGSLTAPRGIMKEPAVVGIWDMASGKEIRSFVAPDATVDYAVIALTPNGKTLISQSRTGLLLVQDAVTGAELRRHQFPRDVGGTLAVSTDGSMIAVGTGANTRKVFVWKWEAGEEPRDFAAPGYNGNLLVFSPDGKLLAESGDTAALVRIWDVSSKELLRKLAPTDHDHYRVYSLVFSPDSKTLIASTGSNGPEAMHLWDMATGKYLRRYDKGATKLAVSADGRLMAGVGSGGIRVWDLEPGKLFGVTDETHEWPVHQIAAVGNLIVTASLDRSIRLWDAATGKQRALLPDNGLNASCIALSADGSKLVSGHYESVCLWETATGRRIYKLPGHGPRQGCRNVNFTADGNHFFSLGSDYRLRKWDVATGKVLVEYALQPVGIKMPDESEDVFARDINAMRLLTLRLGNGIISANGTTLVLDTRQQFHVFDITTGQDLYQLPNQGGQQNALVMSPDCRLLLTSGMSSPQKKYEVSLWELATPRSARKSRCQAAAPAAWLFRRMASYSRQRRETRIAKSKCGMRTAARKWPRSKDLAARCGRWHSRAGAVC